MIHRTNKITGVNRSTPYSGVTRLLHCHCQMILGIAHHPMLDTRPMQEARPKYSIVVRDLWLLCCHHVFHVPDRIPAASFWSSRHPATKHIAAQRVLLFSLMVDDHISRKWGLKPGSGGCLHRGSSEEDKKWFVSLRDKNSQYKPRLERTTDSRYLEIGLVLTW